MEGRKIAGHVILAVGTGLLLFSFYLAYLLFVAVANINFEVPAQITLPLGPDQVLVEIPGLGGLQHVLKAIVQAIFLGIMILAGSKVAEKGVGLLRPAPAAKP